MSDRIQAIFLFFCLPMLTGSVVGAVDSGSGAAEAIQRCDQARTEQAIAKCADPALLERESARLTNFYLQQVGTQRFLESVEQGQDLADRFTTAVVALNQENHGAGEAPSGQPGRTDQYWRQLIEQHPNHLAVHIGQFGYCAVREREACALTVGQSLNRFHPDNAWGPLLLGVAYWDTDRDQARDWFHQAGRRPSSDLGVWQSILLIEQSLRRHLQPAADDPLNHTPAARLETAMAIQSASLPLHLPVQKACSESETSQDLEACLAAAGALAEAQDLILTRMVGLALSARLLDRLGRADEADAIHQRQAGFQEWARSSLARGPAFIDAEEGLRYLRSCAERGEVAALDHYLSATSEPGR